MADSVDPFAFAVALHQAGRLAEAERLYRSILAIAPGHVPALNNLGLLVAAEEAIELFSRALVVWPDYIDSHQNLGNALLMRGEFERAAVCYERARRLRPGDSGLLFNLGKAYCGQGRAGDAAVCFRQALEGRPEDPALLFNLSVVESALGEMAAAAASCERALRLAPDVSARFVHFGNVLRVLGRFEAAIEAYRHALALEPDCVDAAFYLGLLLHAFNRFEAAIRQFEHVVVLRPERVDVYDSLLMTLSYLSDCPIERLLAAHRRYDLLYAPPGPLRPPARPREPERRLRVGYVSDELHEPFAGYFVEPLFRAHDREAVEVLCYSGLSRPDAATGRLKELCEGWRDTSGVGHEALAGLIRDDGIDILVDLSGHAAPNRLLVFTRKPAPVQMTWLGYPATTGLSAMDYRLVDPVTDPPGVADLAATEALVRLERGFLCFQPPPSGAVRAAPFLETGRIRLGSFSNLNKIGGPVVALWAELLRRLPRATLTLKDGRLQYPDVRRKVEAEFAGHGIAPGRLELLPWTDDRMEHLEAFHRLDIALDPFPYNGTTITCEALWMGVPVVSLLGDRHVGRVGASLLTMIGLEELVAGDESAYVGIVVALAGDPSRLARLRQGMRRQLLDSPLCDAAGFARTLEQAYRIAWRRWCGGERLRPFSL